MADDDTFIRNPEIDYSGIPESPPPDPDEPIAKIPGVDYADGTDTAQDSAHEPANAVSAGALAHHTETLNVVQRLTRKVRKTW